MIMRWSVLRNFRKKRSLTLPPEDTTEVTAHQNQIKASCSKASQSSNSTTLHTKRLIKKNSSKVSPDHIDSSSQHTLETTESSWNAPREACTGGSSLQTTDTMSGVSHMKSVRFDTVDTRVFSRVVGDHPDTEIPLAIGWEFADRPSIPVEDFEQEKQTRKMIERIEDSEACKPTKQGKQPPQNGISGPETSKKKLKRAGAFSETSHAVTKSEISSQSEDLEPISMEERVHLLKRVAGYTRPEINREERRRRMQIMMEWTYRKDPSDVTQPCPISNFEVFFNRYVKRNERIPTSRCVP